MTQAIVLYFLAAALTAVILTVAYRLATRYPSPYLSFNFLHLTFFCLAFFASRPIPSLLNLALQLEERQRQFFSAVNLTFIIQPLIVFVLYLEIRFAAAWLEVKITRAFNALYFVLQGAYGLALGFVVFGYLRTWKASAAAFIFFESRDGLFTAFDFSIFAWLIFRSRRLADPERRRGVRTFGSLGFLGLAVYNLASLAGLSGLPQPLLLLAQSLPALFYLNWHVKKEWRHRPVLADAEMERFAAVYRLTAREREIIRLISRGLSNPEIAARLFLSRQTVKNQIHVLFQKLKVKNRVQLINIFRQTDDRPPAEEGSSDIRAKAG
jgi:DNA-binding CsgD family transcriptional regulator